jgi:dihydroorotase
MNLGPVSFKLGLRGMPPEAESGMVERDIRLVTELRDSAPTCTWLTPRRPPR